MKVAKVKTARMEGKAKPIFRISRNVNENLIKHSRNNLNELQNNELANQNFPNSLISFDNSMAFNELNRNPEDYENYYLYRKYLLFLYVLFRYFSISVISTFILFILSNCFKKIYLLNFRNIYLYFDLL